MARYRERKIPIEKFQLSISENSGSNHPLDFPQMDNWLGSALQNSVKDLVCKVSIPSYPFPVFTFLAANSLRELIVDFIIVYCPLLTKIELRNLQNIKSVSISSNHNQSVKIQAPTLEHLSYSGCPWEQSPILDIAECQNLISLELSSIEGCKGLRDIGAPNLVSLEYEGDQIPKLKIAKASGQLKNSQLCLCRLKDLNAAWFGELRKYLLNSTSWSLVDLYFDECDEINMKDLELHHRVANPKVDVLNVQIESSGECPLLVDALLWSCHPRRLYLQSTIEMITCFMDRLMYLKNSRHSTSHGSKPWHSQLKGVKAYKCDSDNQRVLLRSGELVVRTLTEVEEVLFLLDR
ncbi:uncharacterized protein LOC132035037 [Lycium ferocissimum]|uniref:uncharacterized protein LOC132035037 n=1 Tax=Lycium ferocissimum TaxID=112874 RepID=UPI002816257F|nr:uncharacterized protein LOC132035037 [Lycium ferocissimum]